MIPKCCFFLIFLLFPTGILGSPKTCLHSLLGLLCKGIGTPGDCPQCLTDTPKLAEQAYKLIYILAANKDTSLPTLRYLRTSHDFLNRQLQHLPYEPKSFSKLADKWCFLREVVLEGSFSSHTLAITVGYRRKNPIKSVCFSFLYGYTCYMIHWIQQVYLKTS